VDRWEADSEVGEGAKWSADRQTAWRVLRRRSQRCTSRSWTRRTPPLSRTTRSTAVRGPRLSRFTTPHLPRARAHLASSLPPRPSAHAHPLLSPPRTPRPRLRWRASRTSCPLRSPRRSRA